MRILYVAPFVPWPPDKGERIRAFHQIAHLGTEHEVHLACLSIGGNGAETATGAGAALADRCASLRIQRLSRLQIRRRAALGFLAGESHSVAAVRSSDLQAALERSHRLRRFDCVFTFSGSMAGYAHTLDGVPKVVDFVDVDSELWRQLSGWHGRPASWLCRVEAERLARHEQEVAERSDLSIFVSAMEASQFGRRVPSKRVTVVPNGVDLDPYVPVADGDSRIGPPTVVFVGTMDYAPNIDAVLYFHRDVLPILWRRLPALRFHVVGRAPTRRVRSLARDERVTVTGEVPDVRPWLAGATVAIAPFRLGRGVPNKVLEAMASGVPVVGTSLAFQGLADPSSAGTRSADDPERFADEVLTLVRDPDQWRQCARAGRRYVETHHRWQDHMVTLSRLLQDLVHVP